MNPSIPKHPDQDKNVEKRFINSDELLDASYRLAIKVFNSGFHPDYIVGVWRGGAPVGIAVQELLKHLNYPSDHIAIRTSAYAGIAQMKSTIKVHGLHYLIDRVNAEDQLLIVDDIHDTGLSVQQIIKDLNCYCRKNTPTIKVAAPYFKPKNNLTNYTPDYYVEETDQWLVFPHELEGLSLEEISQNKGKLGQYLANLQSQGKL